MNGLLVAAVLVLVPVGACQAAHGDAGTQRKTSMETKEVAPRAVAVSRTPVRVRVTPKNGRSIAAQVEALGRGRRLYVVLRGFRAEEPPSTVYHIYLDLPAGVKPLEDDPRYIGSINFYESYSGPGADDKFRSFDITDVARSLRTRGLMKDGTSITIVPGTDPGAGAKALISKIELIEQ
jgi:hypothetical protein